MRDDRDVEPRLDAYRFFREEWDDYEDLYESFEWEIPETFNMATYLCERWATGEGRPALVDASSEGASDGSATRYSFDQLDEYATQFARVLADRGIERGDRIAVSGAQRVETLVAHVAAWKLGAVSVPLSVLLGPDALSFRLEDSEARAFVAHDDSLEALRPVAGDLAALESTFVVGEATPTDEEEAFWDALEGRASTFETVSTSATDPAMMIYTSGTTGNPKGVVHPHRSMLGALPAVLLGQYNLQVREDDVNRTVVEWSWIGSLYLSLYPALYFGTPTVIDAGGEFDPTREFELIDRYDVTMTGGPATALRMLIQSDRAGRYDLSSVRVIVQGGEALDRDTATRLTDVFENAVVHEVYGQTEALQFVADCTALGVGHEFGKMGVVAPGHTVRVQDPDTGDPVARGEVGEIALEYDGNPMCFDEYWNRPDANAEKVQNGWLRTEDLGVLSEDGYLSFRSRTDDVIISSGYKIGPREIEECLADHDAVADSGVIGVPHDTRGEIPKAFVVLADDADATDSMREALRDHVRSRLAKYQYPRAIEFVDELPKTTTGKVRRLDLREREGLESA
ncbi:acyl-CoA synthetase [Natronolimnohabitans innermongolicus]|uniref:AMP-dependent synthetase and ligase n=1 Tax=Natronolimnohabitans innermongolicus JCM 12255 TaxID=1227499 RepID=L9WPX4_9EURY|nr:AMP-binding protein [Natronolimnohabitans innermongolicus]ELY50398.1 AMP-dependent synthetase and ligase [Natronolimnohabitans innermongolicus JCM 12255]